MDQQLLVFFGTVHEQYPFIGDINGLDPLNHDFSPYNKQEGFTLVPSAINKENKNKRSSVYNLIITTVLS
jgi:hypothetical protein